jgi:hypothetical protein
MQKEMKNCYHHYWILLVNDSESKARIVACPSWSSSKLKSTSLFLQKLKNEEFGTKIMDELQMVAG